MKTTPRYLARWALAACAVIGALAPVTSTSAGSYPPGPPRPFPSITLDTDTVVAGSFFTATVSPCSVGDIIPFTLDGRTVNAVCTNPAARARLQAPTKTGYYTIFARVNSRIATRAIEVVAAGSGGGGGLPTTGLGTLAMSLAIGAASLGTGAGVFVVAKRRSRQRLVA